MRNLLFVSAIALSLVASSSVVGAKDEHFQVLYSFCSQKGCKDGRIPTGLIARDQQGNFYAATTTIDGNSGYEGTIDEIMPNGARYKAKILYDFGSVPSAGPRSGVIRDVNGNLYGTTADVVYELMPPTNHKKWTYKTIYTFCPDGDCSAGERPNGQLSYAGAAQGLPYDGVSPLYGAAQYGGSGGGHGVVYQVVPNGDHWTQSVLYAFCQESGCADGAAPGGVFVAGDGSIYGAANDGGNDVLNSCMGGCGVLFHLTPKGAPTQRGTQWKEETIYTFCSQVDCADGKEPFFPPVMDGDGNLIGATENLVFKLSKSGKHWTLAALHTGITPTSGVTLDTNGTIFGEKAYPAQGEVYRLSGSDFTTLHTFCTKEACKDGGQPGWGLMLDQSGALFGITQSGANEGGSGTLFEITP